MTFKTIALITSGLVALSQPAQAQINGFGDSEGFTVGLGVIANWSPYDGADTPSTTPIPYLAYDWENAHLGVDGFHYDFINTDTVTISALIEPRWSFGDPEDSPLFDDIERDTAIEAGIEAEISFGPFYIGGTVLHDISKVHNGFEASADAGIELEMGPFEVGTKVGYAYRDKGLSQHLYGVRTDEARAGLAAYTPNASWYPYIRTEVFYPIGDRMGILGFAQYEHLNSNATDSPLVSQKRDATLGAAFLRRF